MEKITDILERATGISAGIQIKIFNSLIIILALWLIRLIIVKLIHRSTEDVKTRYVWRKTLTYIAVVLGILLIGSVWFRGFKQLSTFLGLVSAGIAIALKDPITNMAGWLFIILRRSFKVGDRIQLGEHAGDVIDIRLFQFIMLEIGNWVGADQSTGRIIHVPNSKIFTQTMANYTAGFQYIWNEIPVLITFESNWPKAKQLLEKIVRKHAERMSQSAAERIRRASRKFMIFYRNLTPIVYTSVKDSGVLLTLRFLTHPRKRRGIDQGIWEDILTEFAKCADIDFAYPTQRFYRNDIEGKADTRPDSATGSAPQSKKSK